MTKGPEMSGPFFVRHGIPGRQCRPAGNVGSMTRLTPLVGKSPVVSRRRRRGVPLVACPPVLRTRRGPNTTRLPSAASAKSKSPLRTHANLTISIFPFRPPILAERDSDGCSRSPCEGSSPVGCSDRSPVPPAKTETMCGLVDRESSTHSVSDRHRPSFASSRETRRVA